MNRFSLFLTIAVLTLSASGCDFFRQIAGRPTSEEIAWKKSQIEEIERKRAEAEDIDDTLSVVIEELVDNEAVAQPDTKPVAQTDTEKSSDSDMRSTLSSKGIKVSGSKMVSESVKDLIKSRYVIIIGAFGSPANAEAQAARSRELSFDAILIPYSNGLTAVGVCPSDDLSECTEALIRIRKEEFCPADAWILDNSL